MENSYDCFNKYTKKLKFNILYMIKPQKIEIIEHFLNLIICLMAKLQQIPNLEKF